MCNLFLARSCEILTENAFLARNKTLAKFLQEKRKPCKIVARILQDLASKSQNLQEVYFYENFAKVVLVGRFLQDVSTLKKCCFFGELISRRKNDRAIQVFSNLL